jgi:hypothetical protein
MQDGGAGGAPFQQQAGALGGGDGLRRLRRGVERVIGMGLVRQRTQLFPYLKFKETGREGYTVWDTSFSSDGHVLASASGLAVKLFSTSDGALIHRLLGHKANVLSVAMSGESRRVSAGAADSHIIVWDTEKGGAPLFHWFGSGPVHSMAFSQDAELASGSAGDFTLWDEAVQRSSSRPVASKVTCCGWSNGGGASDVSSRLVLGMENGMLSIRAGGGREQAKHRLSSKVYFPPSLSPSPPPLFLPLFLPPSPVSPPAPRAASPQTHEYYQITMCAGVLRRVEFKGKDAAKAAIRSKGEERGQQQSQQQQQQQQQQLGLERHGCGRPWTCCVSKCRGRNLCRGERGAVFTCSGT